jgi:hypothetical protein
MFAMLIVIDRILLHYGHNTAIQSSVYSIKERVHIRTSLSARTHVPMYVRAEMQERTDDGEFDGVWMSHETDVPLRDAFLNGWEDGGGEDVLGQV